MRNKDTLFEFENFTILCQYLYLDPDHYIIINNGIADLKLQMNDDLKILCTNMNFPDLPPMNFTSRFYDEFQGIIDCLKEENPLEFNCFDNRWEEIKDVTLSNLALNKLERRH